MSDQYDQNREINRRGDKENKENLPHKEGQQSSNNVFVMNARTVWERNRVRNVILSIVIMALVIFGPAVYSFFSNPPKEVPLSEIVSDIKEEVEKGDAQDRVTVTVNGQIVELTVKGKNTVKISSIEEGTGFSEILANEEISIDSIKYKPEIPLEIPWGLITTLAMTGLAIGALYYLAKSMQSSGSRLMSFGQSKARLLIGKRPGVTFDDVAGLKEAKQEIQEVVEFLKNPKKFSDMGARIPKGLLMVGPPGSGKTLLARAVAGEAGVPFFHTSGAEFEEMLVGAGASRVRDLFEKAKRVAPSLIFVDEIDAVARKRGTVLQSGNTEQTLNQILVEMDGFEQNENVIVIAATNRPDVLDPAILRPGRFDRRVTLDYPDFEERKEIILLHAKNKPLADDFNLDVFAKRMVGTSGADIENTLNEAAIIATRAERKKITMEDLDDAGLKVAMGPEKRKKLDKETLKRTAVHEVGHALVAKMAAGVTLEMVHKVSIIPRGQSFGHTSYLPEENKHELRTDLFKRIVHLIGGYAAEKVIYDETGAGVSNDIDKATEIARSMVTELGMSEKVGFVKLAEEEDPTALGYRYKDGSKISEKTAEIIDTEVKRIIDEAEQEAVKILNENREILDALVEELLKNEVLLGDEVDAVIRKFGKEPLAPSDTLISSKNKQKKANQRKKSNK